MFTTESGEVIRLAPLIAVDEQHVHINCQGGNNAGPRNEDRSYRDEQSNYGSSYRNDRSARAPSSFGGSSRVPSSYGGSSHPKPPFPRKAQPEPSLADSLSSITRTISESVSKFLEQPPEQLQRSQSGREGGRNSNANSRRSRDDPRRNPSSVHSEIDRDSKREPSRRNPRRNYDDRSTSSGMSVPSTIRSTSLPSEHSSTPESRSIKSGKSNRKLVLAMVPREMFRNKSEHSGQSSATKPSTTSSLGESNRHSSRDGSDKKRTDDGKRSHRGKRD